MKNKKDLRSFLRRLVINWAVPVGCGLIFLFLLKFVFFFGYVPTASMEPAIKEESFILGFRLISELKIGDVVIFDHDGQLLVKRIAALPGDTVAINGEALIVPDMHYFMLGDNAEASVDSRCWEAPFVERSYIIALLPFS